MVNLIAGEETVPELVQRNFRAENVIRELNKIIGEAPPREKMIRGLQRVRQLLSGGQASSLHPAERAAQAIQQLYTNRGLSQNG
jgi:lipid A disaccharide synthetase